MATLAEVVAAIDHILRYKPNWRGTLNDADFFALNEAYQMGKNDPVSGNLVKIDDKILGALRLDNPTLFDGSGGIVDPPGSPPGPRNSPPAGPGVPDDGFSGRAAEAVHRVDEALRNNQTALAKADEELIDALLGAKAGSQESSARLRALQDSVIGQITSLAPTLNTQTGQDHLNEYLQGIVSQIKGIAESSALDAESKTKVLDALKHRYAAVHGSDPAAKSPAAEPAAAGGSGPPTDTAAGGAPAAAAAAPADPLLNGLASDPLMGGLGALAGPAMGALGGLPAAMGAMIPGMGGLGGGGGVPLGDLGSAIGGAIHDATAARGPGDKTGPGQAEELGRATDAHDEDQRVKPAANEPAGAAAQSGRGDQAQPVAAAAGKGEPAATQTGPDVSVKMPDGSTVSADNPQLAHVGRIHLEGASFDDAAKQAQVTLLPAGAPVAEPVSPGQLRFGDYAQFTDHRVMALGTGKVWLGGRVTAIEEMPTGPNFLGWARPEVQPASATTVLAGAH